jgi:hypothetical protein
MDYSQNIYVPPGSMPSVSLSIPIWFLLRSYVKGVGISMGGGVNKSMSR